MVESSHVIPGSRLPSITGKASKRGISDGNEAVNAAAATGARTPSGETERQPQGKKRKAKASSEDSYNGEEVTPSDVDSEPFEEGPTRRKMNKGKEKQHTSEEGEEEDEEGSEWGEEDLDDDDDDDAPLYHHAIWNRLVNLANQLGSYAHPPAHGDEPEDVTAFKACSASWGKDRANRPPVLSLWMPPIPQNNPEYEIEGLVCNDRVVLDWEGEPIREFNELPLTIASTVEGWRVEAWIRNDSRVTYRDIVARMRTKNGAGGRIPIYGTRALATRASNFRDHAGCVSWKLLATQARSRAYMDRLRTPTQRANNLTTDQDLTSAQRAAYYNMCRSRTSQSATVGTAGPSAPRSNVAGSSNAGPSRSRRKAPNFGAAGSVTPCSSAPTRRSSRLRIPRHCQQDSSRNEVGEHNEHEQYYSDKDEELLDTSSVDQGVEGALFETELSDESGEKTLFEVDSIDEGEEEAQLPHSFFLYREAREQFGNTDSDSDSDPFNFDSDDSASDGRISSEPEDPNDARNHMPANIDEAMMLRAALDATREDFKRLTGRDPIQTDLLENYFSQWAAYQTQLSGFLRAQGKTDDQTILFGLDGWTGGISNWKSARPA